MDFKRFRSVFQFLALGIFLSQGSCSIYDPEVKVPSYISIDSFSFQNQVTVNGYNTQSITEAWIFVNNQTIGIYPIPSGRIPVLVEGNASVSVGAGVIADGVNGNKVLYPFYQQFDQQVVFTKEKTTNLRPEFSTKSDLKIPFVYYQDFEKSDSGFTKGRYGTVDLDRPLVTGSASPESFGNRYGRLTTKNFDDVIQYSNDIYLPLRQNGMPVYLEFDYQSTCEIVVGLYGSNNPAEAYDLVLRPTSTWTKIYASLGDEAEAFAGGEKFRFFLRSATAPGIGNSLLIDNIRLIHY
ncbi:MAG TPA: hypothetical protein PKY12_02065 [Catalimonadaceae bacterium]|nr:hypothetical protein [Catalimonadaceae bacterium]